MAEKPLERLNYFNGQRLEASDLRLEQDYHIRVRRWLNKSLYSAGIARGLEVKARTDKPAVTVSPGLALDSAGREIILLEETEVPAVGSPSPVDGKVDGNYLTIQYREQTIEEEMDGCAVRPNGHKAGNRLAWGGPARLLAHPVLAISDVLPAGGSGKVVLAQIELDATCQRVRRVHTNVREYVGGASEANVHQFALEGEKDIDANNSKKIYFHVRGRQPKAVTLYLRAEPFTTLFYTELGNHSHTLTVQMAGGDGKHVHTIESHSTSPGSAHSHLISPTFDFLDGLVSTAADALGGESPNAKDFVTRGLATCPQYRVHPVFGGPFLYPPSVASPQVVQTESAHQHQYGGVTTKANDSDSAHTHSLGTSTAAPAGVNDPNPPFKVRDDRDPLTYVRDLQIAIDGIPCTTAVLSQVVNSRPPNENWKGTFTDNQPHLGDGTSSHPFAVNGTGPIKLDFLPPGIYFDEREHTIELSVASGGGRIQYNLYVE